MALYPVFLKKQPLIWGISLSDIFKLTAVMFVGSLLDVSQELILLAIVVIYGGVIAARRLFPKRHFEFRLRKKERLPLHLAITNAKEKVL